VKKKFRDAFMKTAEVFSELSSAKRLHVGAIVVKDDRIISIGYNGMPSGWDNNCEDDEFKTRPEVLHAETNAIAKLAKSTESGNGAAMFITHSPCLDCAKLIFQSGINSVYYRNEYRDSGGIDFLRNCKIDVEKI
jgi:dCMP deaminase